MCTYLPLVLVLNNYKLEISLFECRTLHLLGVLNKVAQSKEHCYITTVGGCLSKHSSSVSNLAIGWVSQSATAHSCEKERCNRPYEVAARHYFQVIHILLVEKYFSFLL